MPFGKCALDVRFADVMEYIPAAVGVEVAPVVCAVALDAEDI